MCLSPSFVWVEKGPGYEKIPVPCKGCWQCRVSRLNDYVGRCLCEAAYAKAISVITLTYAPRDDLADKVITPRHFQDFIRALRRRGHKLRYIATAEYGALKGRAHFHCILFWQMPKEGVALKPDMPHKAMFHFEPGIWDHGHAFNDDMSPNAVDEKAIRYVCKYLLKDEDKDKGDSWMTLSKKPPIGCQFFLDKADRDAALGVFPASFNYRPPFSHDGRSYLLSGATKRFYLERLIDQMSVKHNVPKTRLNEWTLKAVEKLEKWQWNREYLDAMTPEENLAFLEEKLDLLRPSERDIHMSLAREDHDRRKKYSENLQNFLESDLTSDSHPLTFERYTALLQKELTEWLGRTRRKGTK